MESWGTIPNPFATQADHGARLVPASRLPPGLPWLTQAGEEGESRLSLGGLLKQAWGLFQVDFLDEAEKTTRELISRLEPLAARSAVSARLPNESNLLLASAKTVLGCIAERRIAFGGDTQRLEDEAADLFADAAELFDRWLKWPGAPSSQVAQDYRFYGIALDRVGRREEAIAAIEEALRLGDTSSESFRLLANLYKDLGTREKDDQKLKIAETHAREALRLTSSSPTTHTILGEILEAQGRTAEAVEAYLQAVQAITSTNPERLREALGILDRAEKLAPGDSKIATLRGMIHSFLGQPELALAALEPVVQSDPDDVWALLGLGGVLLSLNRLEDSERVLRKAVEKMPDLIPAQFELARTLHALGRHAEEIEALDHVLSQAPNHLQALVLKGKALVEIGRGKEAVELLSRTAELAP